MEILVTGGAGFIGSHTVEALLARGERVIALDNFNDFYDPERKRRNIAPFLSNPNFRLVQGDIRDRTMLEHLFTTEPIRRIVHIAAMANPRFSIKDPLLYNEVNVVGTLNLVELAVRQGVQHFVFASSSSIYGGDASVPYKEDARTDRPLSPYAATKKMSEVLLYTFHYLYGLPVTVLRFFTVYGERGRPDMAVYLFTDWIARNQPVRLFGDGSQSRDYTYVQDTVSGVVAALDRPSGYQTYNLGNSNPQTNAYLIEVIERTLGKKAIIEMLDYPSADPVITCADITRARADLGYNPQVPLEEGVPRFIKWYEQEMKNI
ncbi:MAG: NAD-dependent epimerase/dehydratase family protein [Chloroflexia bacterium]